jgi:outer membrane protein assembly factor BamB
MRTRIIFGALCLVLASAAALHLAAQAAKKEPAGSVPDWGQFRGPKRDGVSPDTGLLKQWPQGGPPLLWKATGLGEGYSSVSIAGKYIFTMGDIGGSACVVALNAADGKPLWTSKIGRGGAPAAGYPGTRSTPATDGTHVFALSQHGDLACLQAATGKVVWSKNLGGEMMSGWGYSESPLLDGGMVLCTPGGSGGTVLALNKVSGATVWQSAQFKDKAAYASLVPVEIGKVPQYLVFTDKSVAGIAARNGQLVWKADRPGRTAVIPTPVYKDGIVFVSSGYDVGCNAFQVTGAGGQFRVQEIYKGDQIVNHHGGLILVGDHVYGLGDGGNSLKCIELKTGKVAWQNSSVGKGSIAYADGHLYCRSEAKNNSAIALVEATPEGYKEKGRFTQPETSGKEAWPHPVVFGGRLYIRDQDKLFCFDVKAK